MYFPTLSSPHPGVGGLENITFLCKPIYFIKYQAKVFFLQIEPHQATQSPHYGIKDSEGRPHCGEADINLDSKQYYFWEKSTPSPLTTDRGGG